MVFKLLSILQQQKKINSIALSVKKKFSESPSLLYYNSVLKPSRKQLFDWYRSISFWEPKRKWFQLFLIIIFHYYTSAENWKNHTKSFFPYYSKTFVVTFLKYKIDPDSLLTQHDLFRTRKNRVIWNIFVCVYVIVGGRGDSRKVSCWIVFLTVFTLQLHSFFITT